ncbi:MAG: enoyl-CoA hydratase/isomerase family protein [Chloroflexi bacterium]|nr:enoyl-CoA hydratase/isomerase family protein [Chloroflexota bacterium]
MTSAFQTILFSKENGLAGITLNRPEVINAYSVQMRDELYQALEAVREDDKVAVVVLQGAGEKGFCTGADLKEFGTAPSQAVARSVRFERDIWGLWASIQKPFICLLHGYVMGSGLEMALLCDIRIASEDVALALPEAGLGMIPAAGGTQTLSRASGLSSALEMVLTGRRLTAWEALRLGLVSRVVPRERLHAEGDALARELLRRSPSIMGLLKEAVNRGAELPLASALEMEEKLALQAALARM